MRTDQILKRPIITEKSLAEAALGNYTFEVDGRARKSEIAQAVELVFGVHVKGVRTVNLKGKKRHFGPRRRIATTPSVTKAVVQLAPGEKIDLFAVPGQEEVKSSKK